MNRGLMPYIQILFNTLIQPIYRRTQQIFRSIVRMPYRAVRKLASYLAALTRKRETSLKDYVEFHDLYIARKIFLIAFLVLIALVWFGSQYLKGDLKFYNKLYTTDTTTYSGNGKVFDNRQNNFMLYKGSLLEGQYSGKGTRYYPGPNSVIEYVGDFANGLANGNGSSYSKTGQLLYQGGFINDHYDGQGRLYWNGKVLKYQGDLKNGEYNGTGKFYSAGGKLLYEGLFLNGEYSGAGKEYYPNGSLKYEGLFANSAYNGNGKFYTPDGLLAYVGGFKGGLYDGAGEKYSNAGKVSVASLFAKGLAEGKGTEFYSDGKIKFAGLFKAGLYDAAGAMNYDNENNTPKYEGTFKAGKFDGVGKLYSDTNELLYEGEFAGGALSGYGIKYSGTDVAYTGDFNSDKPNGFGTSTGQNKTVLYTGFFQNGKPYPQGYLNINEQLLEEKLGPPTATALDSENVVTHSYDAPAMKFRVHRNASQTWLTVFDVFLYEPMDVFGINVSMTASEVKTLLGPPTRTYSGPAPASNLPAEKAAMLEPGAQAKFLVYNRSGYQIIIPFNSMETEMMYIELKAK